MSFRLGGTQPSQQKTGSCSLMLSHPKSDNSFYQYFKSSSDAMFLISEGTFFECNDAALNMLSLPNGTALKGVRPRDLSPEFQPCGVSSNEKADFILECVNRAGSHQFQWLHQEVLGQTFLVEVTLTKVVLEGKERLHAIWRKIRSFEQRARELAIASLVFSKSTDAVMITDHSNTIIDVNPAFSEITGYQHSEAVGQPAGFMKSGKHDRSFYVRLWSSLQASGEWQGRIWDRHKKGHLLPKDVTIKAVPDESGRHVFYIAIFADVSELLNYKKELEKLAFYDSLTSSPNRTLLLDTLEQKIERLEREDQANFAVAFVDIDKFKLFNDTKGHSFGDELIKRVAERLSSMLGKEDIVGRMSGDEFLIIFDENKSKQQVVNTINELIQSTASPIAIQGLDYHVKYSIGVSHYPDDGESVKDLLARADIAMYRVKQSGGNNCVWYDNEIGCEFSLLNEIESQLSHAISQGLIFPVFQPLVSLTTGGVVALESLARWQKADGTFIPPLKFVDVAQKSNQIGELSTSILRQSCQYYACMGLHDSICLSINITAQELVDPVFQKTLFESIHNFGLEPSSVELELTEHAIVENFSKAKTAISYLRSQGIKIAIDDFGTGFSALSYLKSLDFDTLKIDRSFIKELDKACAKSIVILESTINLAHRLGARVVAEGVETESQLHILKTLKCDYAQGFLFSKPLTSGAFTRYFHRNNQSY